MRKLKLFLSLLMLFTFSVGNVWAETYVMFPDGGDTFNSAWSKTSRTAKQTYANEVALQLMGKNKGVTGEITSNNAFAGISAISVSCTANKELTLTLSYSSDNSSWEDLSTETIAKNASGYDNYDLTITNIPSTAVYLKMSTSGNSIYIYSVTIETGSSEPTLSSIEVATAPTTLTYTEGDFFDPAGLVITENYSDESTKDVAYEGNEDKFSFEPALNEALATTDTKVTITYAEKTVDQTITVTEATCQKVAVSKGSETNGTYTLSATEVCSDGDGGVVFITDITPAEGYELDDITATVGTVDKENNKVTGITANTTITVTFKELPKYTVSFNVGGSAASQADITEASYGAGITLPAGPTPTCSADGWTFAGWAAAAVAEQTTTAPTLLAAGANYKPSADCTLFAVYKRIEGGAVEDASATETFTNQTAGTTYDATQNYSESESDASIAWTMYYGTVSTNDVVSSGNNAQMRWYSSATSNVPYIKTTTPVSGLQSFSFKARVSNTNVKVSAWYSTDGANWTLALENQAFTSTGASGVINPSITVNGTLGTGYYIKIGVGSSSTAPSSGNYKLGIDDVVFDYKNGSSTTYYLSSPSCCTPHAVNIAAGIENGSVSADPTSACEGATITLTFTPELNYHLSAWTLNDVAQDIAVNTFTMPDAAVTVSATFAQDECDPLSTPSVTVSGKAYPYDAVKLSWTAIEHADAYKVYIYDNEDNELEHNDAFAGVEYTIGQTLSASTTYKYSVQAISNTPATYCPSTEAESTFTTDALPTAHLTLIALGEEQEASGDYAILTPFNLPSTAASCAKTFMGWDANPECATIPTYAKGAEFTFQNTTGVTLYAVYANETPGEAILTKMGSNYAPTAGDKLVIVGVDGDDKYALYRETQSSSYVQYWAFDNKVATVAADAKKYVTLETATDGKFYLGDATNGYVYSSGSNNLSVDASNKTAWTIAWDNEASAFTFNQGRYLSCRSDLSGANQYLYRLAGSTPAGIYQFDVYKYATSASTYDNYSTTCVAAPTAEPASASIAVAAAGDEGTLGVSYENVNLAGVTVALYNNEACTEAFDGGWLTASIAGDDKHIAYNAQANISYNDARTAYIKLSAPETTGAADPAIVVIPVTQAKKDAVFASFEDLVAAELATNTTVTVSFENLAITDIYANKSGQRKGVYFDINEVAYEIYHNSELVPNTWIIGGTISGTITGNWTYYNDGSIWEVVPTTTDWTWAELTYTKPEAPISWSAAEATAYTVGKEYTLPTLNNEESLAVAYSATGVATVDELTGAITALSGAGDAVITATYTEDVYQGKAVSYTLHVYAPTKIEVGGEATTTTYEAGDAVSFAGLTATVTYGNDETLDVTSNDVFTASPATIAANTTEVSITATKFDMTSTAKVVDVTVNTHAVSLAAVEHGTVTLYVGEEALTLPANLVKGTTVNVTATPIDNNYSLTALTAGEENILAAKQFEVGTADIVVSATFTEKATAPISWGKDSETISLSGDAATLQTLTNDESLTVTYSSDNTDVATISNEEGHEGEITIKAVGTTTISAEFAGNETYKATTVSYELTVTCATLPAPTNVTVTNITHDGATFNWDYDAIANADGYYLEVALYDDPKDIKAQLGGLTKGELPLSVNYLLAGTHYVYKVRAFSNDEVNYCDNGWGETYEGDFTTAAPPTYSLKNNWNGGEWAWKEMTYVDGEYILENVVFGGTGVNWRQGDSGDGTWVELASFVGDNIQAWDTVTLAFHPYRKDITATLLHAYVAPSFYITGADLVGGWVGDDLPVKGTSYTIENVAAGSYAMQITTDGTWSTAKGFSDLTASEIIAGLYSSTENNNIYFTLAEAGDVTVTYTGEVFKLAGNFVSQKVRVKGGWDSWAETHEMIPSGDKKSASVTFTISPAENVEFGVELNGTDYRANGGSFDRENNSATGITGNSGNMKLTSDRIGEYTFTWTFGTNALDITFPHIYTVVSSAVIGTLPSTTIGELVKQGSTDTYLLQFTNVDHVLKGSYDIEVYEDNTVDPVAATTLEISATGLYNIDFTFNASEENPAKALVVEAVYQSPATDIDNTGDGQKAVKVMKDNTIYIIRGDKTYTITGQVVK